MKNLFRTITRPASLVLIIGVLLSLYIGKTTPPTWTIERMSVDAFKTETGQWAYTYKKNPVIIENLISIENAYLTPQNLEAVNAAKTTPAITEEFVIQPNGDIQRLKVTRHWGIWSLLPAIVAILLCWIVKEPITALSGGIIAGAFLIGKFNILDDVLVPTFMSKNAATVLILYLWLLGGLMGMWEKTGASKAFAEFMAKHFVRGPKTAKVVAWLLGIIFFQGGTVSAVLVGTTVRPLADEERVSHEELSFIVDSTSSPIAILLPFNAWPSYVQAFSFVGGAAWLATEADRIAFFFKSIPFNFYAIFAITSTLLLSIERLPWCGQQLNAAIRRSRETGELDAPDAEPVNSLHYDTDHVPSGYRITIGDFFIPLLVVLGFAISTYITLGSPKVLWAFGLALMTSILMAFLRGMGAKDVIDGLSLGFKGVVLGSLILLLAMTIGAMSKATGGGAYLVDLLGSWIPFWLLPGLLALLTMFIAFATGTSWGTFAVSLPLALPLSFHVGMAHGLVNLEFFMLICFCSILNGAVFGDQCSPISDTTILSATTTGCDLMDHVKTQFEPAAYTALLSAIMWTLAAVVVA